MQLSAPVLALLLALVATSVFAQDPACDTGVLARQGDACCVASCVKCKKKFCESRGDECCPTKIRADAVSCLESGPPCLVMSPSPSPSITPIGPADPSCDLGVLATQGDVCCPAECGECRKFECELRGTLPNSCCPPDIRASGMSCADQGAPCLLTSGTPTPSITPVGGPDPECMYGVLATQGDVCCAGDCGICRKLDCETRGAIPGSCCPPDIRAAGITCLTQGGPCLIASPSPSVSPSPTASITVSPTVSVSLSPTASVTASISVSPSVTASITVSPTVTPSISGSPSVTPTVTTSVSVTPSVTPSFTPPGPPDVNCDTGILANQGDACCPADCGVCVKADCVDKGPYPGACCPPVIRASNIFCLSQGPPCIVI